MTLHSFAGHHLTRRRSSWLLAVTACAVATAGVALAQDATVEEPKIDAPAWYTEAQAETGASAYEANCSECHGDEMVESIRSYPNAGRFYGFVSSQMPADNPGGLSPETYAAIVAYLLSANGFPAGDEELQPGRGPMGEVIIRDLIPAD